MRQWQTRRQNIKSWIIASLCKEIKIKQLSHVRTWLPTGTLRIRSGRQRETASADDCTAISREEIALGFQKLVVNILDVANPHIKEHIADFSIPLEEIRKHSFLGTVQDWLSADRRHLGTHLMASADHYRRTNTSVRHQAGSVRRTTSKVFGKNRCEFSGSGKQSSAPIGIHSTRHGFKVLGNTHCGTWWNSESSIHPNSLGELRLVLSWCWVSSVITLSVSIYQQLPQGLLSRNDEIPYIEFRKWWRILKGKVQSLNRRTEHK